MLVLPFETALSIRIQSLHDSPSFLRPTSSLRTHTPTAFFPNDVSHAPLSGNGTYLMLEAHLHLSKVCLVPPCSTRPARLGGYRQVQAIRRAVRSKAVKNTDHCPSVLSVVVSGRQAQAIIHH
jgi:hypothetical protein